MTKFVEAPISEFFLPVGGDPKYIREFIEKYPGDNPVYSASLRKPFGYIRKSDYEGTYLTWIMNGYGGRIQEISGKFSVNRDRGVFIPRDGIDIPDLTYLRFVMEPQLSAAAVGRRVDGRLNEYTKIYPEAAGNVLISIPLDVRGGYDHAKMLELGDKFKNIEIARRGVIAARDALKEASQSFEVEDPFVTVELSDVKLFHLSIGERVLLGEGLVGTIPIYSANVLRPFARTSKSNLDKFDMPSLIWGIDGNFDWNFIEAGSPFATTDHCGRLQIIDGNIDPSYVYWYLKLTRFRCGFDRVFRSSLTNIRAELTVDLPIDRYTGLPSLERQKIISETARLYYQRRAEVLDELDEIISTKVGLGI